MMKLLQKILNKIIKRGNTPEASTSNNDADFDDIENDDELDIPSCGYNEGGIIKLSHICLSLTYYSDFVLPSYLADSLFRYRVDDGTLAALASPAAFVNFVKDGSIDATIKNASLRQILSESLMIPDNYFYATSSLYTRQMGRICHFLGEDFTENEKDLTRITTPSEIYKLIFFIQSDFQNGLDMNERKKLFYYELKNSKESRRYSKKMKKQYSNRYDKTMPAITNGIAIYDYYRMPSSTNHVPLPYQGLTETFAYAIMLGNKFIGVSPFIIRDEAYYKDLWHTSLTKHYESLGDAIFHRDNYDNPSLADSLTETVTNIINDVGVYAVQVRARCLAAFNCSEDNRALLGTSLPMNSPLLTDPSFNDWVNANIAPSTGDDVNFLQYLIDASAHYRNNNLGCNFGVESCGSSRAKGDLLLFLSKYAYPRGYEPIAPITYKTAKDSKEYYEFQASKIFDRLCENYIQRVRIIAKNNALSPLVNFVAKIDESRAYYHSWVWKMKSLYLPSFEDKDDDGKIKEQFERVTMNILLSEPRCASYLYRTTSQLQARMEVLIREYLAQFSHNQGPLFADQKILREQYLTTDNNGKSKNNNMPSSLFDLVYLKPLHNIYTLGTTQDDVFEKCSLIAQEIKNKIRGHTQLNGYASYDDSFFVIKECMTKNEDDESESDYEAIVDNTPLEAFDSNTKPLKTFVDSAAFEDYMFNTKQPVEENDYEMLKSALTKTADGLRKRKNRTQKTVATKTTRGKN